MKAYLNVQLLQHLGKYKTIVERDIKIKMSDGTEINADIFRPDSDEKFPAIFRFDLYDQMVQTAPMMTNSFSTKFFRHPGQEMGNAHIEAGDPDAYVCRTFSNIYFEWE